MNKIRNRNENHRKTAEDRERTIMGMWDAGKGSKAIARELNVSDQYVMNIISLLACNNNDHWQRDAVQATIQLASRIRDVHPQMVGAA